MARDTPRAGESGREAPARGHPASPPDRPGRAAARFSWERAGGHRRANRGEPRPSFPVALDLGGGARTPLSDSLTILNTYGHLYRKATFSVHLRARNVLLSTRNHYDG